MAVVRVRALAKINLHLAIHAQRPDGYHDLTTIFQSIALHDTLSVEAHDGPFVLECGDPDVPADESNLVWRAAAAYARVTGHEPLAGLRVVLEKGVPTQAGLGGGSADAIAMLRALGSCWGTATDAPLMKAVGRELGADAPFFVDGGTALGLGRGDELTSLVDLPSFALVIVCPPFGVGTADAYRWVVESRHTAPATGERPTASSWPQTSEAWRDRLGTLYNEFEPVVAARFPTIDGITGTLRDAGAALAMLSGSGSAVVGLFEDADVAAEAQARFGDRPGWRSWVTTTVRRDAYRAAVEPRIAEG